MKTFKEALINLMRVKSLFSITAIIVIILSIFFPIPDWVQEVCKTIVVFYFGTQASKLADEEKEDNYSIKVPTAYDAVYENTDEERDVTR